MGMKESLMDKIDRHVIYFLTGIVAMVSTMLVTTFIYMLLLPIVVFGQYYLIVLPIFLASIYYVGRRIMNDSNK
jgi:hypothetical protein